MLKQYLCCAQLRPRAVSQARRYQRLIIIVLNFCMQQNITLIDVYGINLQKLLHIEFTNAQIY